MSQERLKILELLSEGKINVEEASQLLEAIGEGRPPAPERPERPERPSRRRRRHGEGRRGPARMDWGDFSMDFDNLSTEIQDRVSQARETLRASMPKMKETMNEAMPNVDRIVREATSSIPDVGRIVRETIRSATEAVSDWSGDESELRNAESAEREVKESMAVEPGSRVALRNPRGHVKIETCEESEIQVNGKISTRAHTQEVAQAMAEQITVEVKKEPDVVRIDARIPEQDERPQGVGKCRVDFVIKVPRKIDLDLRSAHGNIQSPEIEGAIVLRNRHGNTKLAGASGNVWIGHAHGMVDIDQVGADLTLEVRHGNVNLEAVKGAATLQVTHGNLNLENVGRNAEIAIGHGALNVGTAGEDLTIDAGHGPVAIRTVGGKLALNVKHGPVSVESVEKSAHASNRHSPISLNRVGGDLVIQNSHGPIDAENVAGQATVKTGHSGIRLRNVSGGVAAENDHGSITLEKISGPIAVRSKRGSVEITDAEGEIAVQNDGGGITIGPGAPIKSDYTLQNRRGSVKVVVPEGSAVEVQGHVKQGKIHTDLPLDIQGTERKSQSITGQLNGGGSKITVDVEGGDLSIT